MTRYGILMMNTGTPDAPTEEAIRNFLGEMLSDRMLISAPPVIWNQVLKRFILPSRPKRTVPLYEKMWTDVGSRFLLTSERQRDLLAAELAQRGFNGGEFEVALAMRYGNPSVAGQLEALRARGCDCIVVLPLYPQYVKVCAGTCIHEVKERVADLADIGWKPQVIAVPWFYDQPSYQAALADSVRSAWSYRPGAKLCISFHSTLMADIEAGDPYNEQNLQTARSLAEALGVPEEDWALSYQSRFDSRKWLQPFTVDVLNAWAQQGVRDVCAVCPGFVAENIESKIETGETLRAIFLGAAPEGATYTYVPTLDCSSGLIDALASATEQAVSAHERGEALPTLYGI